MHQGHEILQRVDPGSPLRQMAGEPLPLPPSVILENVCILRVLAGRLHPDGRIDVEVVEPGIVVPLLDADQQVNDSLVVLARGNGVALDDDAGVVPVRH